MGIWSKLIVGVVTVATLPAPGEAQIGSRLREAARERLGVNREAPPPPPVGELVAAVYPGAVQVAEESLYSTTFGFSADCCMARVYLSRDPVEKVVAYYEAKAQEEREAERSWHDHRFGGGRVAEAGVDLLVLTDAQARSAPGAAKASELGGERHRVVRIRTLEPNPQMMSPLLLQNHPLFGRIAVHRPDAVPGAIGRFGYLLHAYYPSDFKDRVEEEALPHGRSALHAMQRCEAEVYPDVAGGAPAGLDRLAMLQQELLAAAQRQDAQTVDRLQREMERLGDEVQGSMARHQAQLEDRARDRTDEWLRCVEGISTQAHRTLITIDYYPGMSPADAR